MGGVLSTFKNITGDILGTNNTGSDLAKAGMAQYTQAQQAVTMSQQGIAQQEALRQSSIAQAQSVAALSPGEINQINSVLDVSNQALQANMTRINATQSQLDQMDPNIKQAGQNLYNLMSGQSASILQPLQTQIGNQRQKLQDSLAAQMGPGYATSSAGIQALLKFDDQASLTMNQAQMNAIQITGSQYAGLSGLKQQGMANLNNQTREAYGQSLTAQGEALQARQYGQTRVTNATMQAMGQNQINYQAPVGAQMGVAQMAGMPYQGNIYKDQAFENTMGYMSGAAGAGLVSGMLGAKGAGRSGVGGGGGGGGYSGEAGMGSPGGTGNYAGGGDEGDGSGGGMGGGMMSAGMALLA